MTNKYLRYLEQANDQTDDIYNEVLNPNQGTLDNSNLESIKGDATELINKAYDNDLELVSNYLKDMGSVDVLSKEDEVSLG